MKPERDGQGWTREETLAAFNRYWHIPYGRLDRKNPEIIALASLLRRTPSSVSRRMCNFAYLDPAVSQTGLTHASKLDEQIWEEYHAAPADLIFESEKAAAAFNEQTVEERADVEADIVNIPEGKDRERLVKARVNDGFFRRAVFSSYRNQCCITGLATRTLLNACHIVPWSANIREGLNPRNGLCMNVLHHKAFDLGLLTVTPAGVVKVSPRLIESALSERAAFVVECNGDKIEMPERFRPERKFLEYHNREVFQRN